MLYKNAYKNERVSQRKAVTAIERKDNPSKLQGLQSGSIFLYKHFFC